MKEFLEKFINLFEESVKFAEKRVQEYGARYTAFGVFSLICFVLPVYMWSVKTAGYRSVLVFRVLAIILSFFLAVSDVWYASLKKYLPLYWYLTVTFCLPFMGTYLIIIDGLSLFWIVNIAILLILGMVLLDFLSFIVIFPVGVISAFVCAHFLGHDLHNINVPHELIYPSCYLLFFVFAIAVVFFKNKEQVHMDKIRAMKSLAGSIAHELRTPIATIRMQLDLTKRDIAGDKENKLESINRRASMMLNEAKYINYLIDMTLARLREHNEDMSGHAEYPISEYIDYAISRYPFGKDEENLVDVKVLSNFSLKGDKSLMSQVLFNLIQNALHQIKSVNKGKIYITATQNRKHRILIVKDTSTGIKREYLESIFRPFVTKRKNGTGIGLYFCQSTIRAMNGSIRCESVYGEYTSFIIEF